MGIATRNLEGNRSKALYFLIPVLLAGIGGYFASREVFQTESDSDSANQVQEVESQASILSEWIWNDLNSVWKSPKALFRAEYLVDKQTFGAPRVAEWNSSDLIRYGNWWKQIQPTISARLSQLILAKLSIKTIQNTGYDLVRFVPDESRTVEWLVIGVRAGNAIQVVLVDPRNFFTGFSRLKKEFKKSGARAYLMAVDGKVLVHTDSSYDFRSFTGSQTYDGPVLTLLEGASRQSVSGHFVSFDSMPVAATFMRLGSLPVVLAVEKVDLRESLANRRMRWGGAERVSGAILFWLVVSIVSFIGVTRVQRGMHRKVTSAPPVPQEPQAAVAEITALLPLMPIPEATSASPGILMGKSGHTLPPIPKIPDTVLAAMEKQSQARDSIQALKAKQKSHQLVLEFEQNAIETRNPRVLAKRLTQIAAELSQSPTLFFTYSEGLRSAVLHADAGFTAGLAPFDLAFVISEQTLSSILEVAQKGTVPSFATDPELSKLMLNRLNVAHFEAWGMTAYGTFGRQLGRPRLLGVLVILQPGVDSTQHFHSLSQMLKTTGLVYENTLISI